MVMMAGTTRNAGRLTRFLCVFSRRNGDRIANHLYHNKPPPPSAFDPRLSSFLHLKAGLGMPHPDRAAAAAAAACLTHYLQHHQDLSFAEAAAVVANVPAFVADIAASVSSALERRAGCEVSPANAASQIEQIFQNRGVSAWELVLESVGVPRSKVGDVLSSFAPDAHGWKRLLQVVAALEGIEIPRKKVGNLLRREQKLLTVPLQTLTLNLEFLGDLGVKKEHFGKVVKRCPSILAGSLKETLQPLVAQLEELGADSKRVIRHNLEYNAQRILFSGLAKLQELKSLYLQHKISDSELAKALNSYPRLLALLSESNWTKSLGLLKGVNVENEDLGRIIRRNPPLLTCSVNSNLKPKLDFLVSIGVGKENLPRILKRCPTLFCFSIEQNLKPKLEYLQSIGLKSKDIGKIVVLRPSILRRSFSKSFRGKVKFLQLLGFHTGSHEFFRALCCLYPVSLETLESRMKQLTELGFSLNEIFLMVRRNPKVLSVSNKQFQAKIEFLVNITAYSLKDLVIYPVYFNLNLEGRIIPRHRFLSWLISNGKLKKSYSLSFIASLSEKQFQAKFLERFPEYRVTTPVD